MAPHPLPHLAGSGDELQEERGLLLGEAAQHGPELRDLQVRGLVAVVVGVGPQVVQVDVRQPADQKL